MASSTLEYMKKQHPDSWSDTIREHTNAPYIKDSVQGPLGALAQGAKKAANALAEAAATDHEDVQGNLSDKGAKAEQARRASLNTESEEAVSVLISLVCVVLLNSLFLPGQGRS
jgi:regulator of protease activity HflC (stomatin/prohibitin superfamily)